MGILFSSNNYNPETDIPDLSGKVVLVTGGNSGIGYETVKAFVKKGAKVYLGARNESRATGAIAQLKADGVLDMGNGSVIWLPLDLATPKTTTAGAQDFLRREGRLDILGECKEWSGLMKSALLTSRPRRIFTLVNNAAM